MTETGEFTVLLYHGVHENSLAFGARNSSGKHISEGRFDEEMRWLSENRPLVTMADIGAALAGRSALSDGAVAITFDDGFLNNYSVAWPILEKHKIPAIIYLATGFIGTGQLPWSDILEDAILGTDRPNVRIDLEGGRTEWPLQSELEKITAYTEIKLACKKLPDNIKNDVVSSLKLALEYDPTFCHQLSRFMDWEQVREMDRSDLIDFGAHTVDHVVLSKVTEAEMHHQIDQSIAAVTDALARPCTQFAYPEGQAGDFDEPVIDYLRGNGISFCPSAIDGINRTDATDPFHIKRIMVGLDGRKFPFETGTN